MKNDDAINYLENMKWLKGYDNTMIGDKPIVDIIDGIITLLQEQEAKNGEWITIWQKDDPDTSIHARCSICNRISERPLGGYCKWCGAKMNQERGVDG